MRISLIGTSIFFMAGPPLEAASVLTGNPLNYKPVTVNRADASLQDIRTRALSGNLTTDDILKAAEQIKAVQQTPDATAAAVPTVTPPAQTAAPGPVYARSGAELQIPVDDSASPLGASGRAQLYQTLDRLPLRHLFLVHDIQVAAPVMDPDRGQLQVQTQGDRITLYGTADLQGSVIEGAATLVYESMRNSPLEAEWRTHGDFTDFVQTYEAWVDNTQQAFEEAKRSEQAPEELSKLFFVASLFTDDSMNRITTYDPAPKDEAWKIQQGRYGFGPYTFEVYRNQIVHLARNGVILSASAVDIPSLWNRQGLGN